MIYTLDTWQARLNSLDTSPEPEHVVKPRGKIRIKHVPCKIDGATSATVTIDRERQILTVRGSHRRAEYSLPLSAICEIVFQRNVIADVKTARRVKRYG